MMGSMKKIIDKIQGDTNETQRRQEDKREHDELE